MRMGFIATGVILILVILLLFFTHFLETTVNKVISGIEKTENLLTENNIKEAEKSFIKAKKIWDNNERIYKLQIEHSELGKINELFSDLEAYFENKGNEEFLKNSHTLKYFLSNLVSKNKVSLETIL